jgi:hypothetical protein
VEGVAILRLCTRQMDPTPVALGALVLVLFRYKKRMGSKEIHVDENGKEVVRLRGPGRYFKRIWGAFSLHLLAYMRIFDAIGPCFRRSISPKSFAVMGVHQFARTARLVWTYLFSSLRNRLRLQPGRD